MKSLTKYYQLRSTSTRIAYMTSSSPWNQGGKHIPLKYIFNVKRSHKLKPEILKLNVYLTLSYKGTILGRPLFDVIFEYVYSDLSMI